MNARLACWILLSFLISATSVWATVGWIKHSVDPDYDCSFRVFAVDMDNDNDFDFVATARNDRHLAWYENDGAGDFTYHMIDDYPQHYDVAAADLDGDADIDVVVAIEGGSFILYENLGDETFSRQYVNVHMYKARFLQIFDLDQDGDQDLILSGDGTYGHPVLSWFENDGELNFTQYDIFEPEDDWAAEVSVVDLDLDGLMDVVRGSYDASGFFWHRSLGNNLWNQIPINANADNPLKVWADKINGDIYPDIAVGSTDDGIYWFETVYDGDWSFVKHDVDPDIEVASDIIVIDLNNDSHSDIASVGFNSAEVVWYEADGAGDFEKRFIDDDRTSPRSLAVADFTGDGLLDVLITTYWYDGLFLYEAIHETGCWVGGQMWTGGEPDPENVCQVCQPAIESYDWTNVSDGMGCNDNMYCTGGDLCLGGQCTGHVGSPCSDGEVCIEETQSCAPNDFVDLISFEANQDDGAAFLVWFTSSENGCFGFHLLRGQSETDAFVRITSGELPGEGVPDQQATYAYSDETVEGGMTYWYKLEAVADSGPSAFYGPVSITIDPEPPLVGCGMVN